MPIGAVFTATKFGCKVSNYIGGNLKKNLLMSTRVVLATTVSACLLAAGLGPAVAADDRSDGSPAIEYTQTSPLSGDAEPPIATVPIAGAEILTTDESSQDSISVSLPGTPALPEDVDLSGVPAGLFHGDDAPLVSTALPDASVTAYATEYGSQSIISIEGEAAPHEYRFDLDLPSGASAEVNADGSVRIVDVDGQPLGLVQVPWAYDANGAKVPTSFSLAGSQLIQTISHDASTAYPVKADPSIQWIPWPVLAVWGAEIKAFSSISVALAAGGSWAGCTFSRLSGALSKIVNQICTVVGIAGVKGVVDAVASVWGPSYINSNTCYGVPLYNPRGGLATMPARDCW
ncbi:hypothetical protein ABIA52_000703 [Paenarthrobacter histidinolovorans]|uniref:Uncharacterized protein n=2 Tax=Paenarthrobacter histidinolovorans TaxID=43664 RepID=A0ABW8N1C2_9MICC